LDYFICPIISLAARLITANRFMVNFTEEKTGNDSKGNGKMGIELR
jgi:hypothetical protein